MCIIFKVNINSDSERTIMRRVLLICHTFSNEFPIPRIQGLIKYLPEYGWEPILLTYGAAQKFAVNKEKQFSNPIHDFKKIKILLLKWVDHHNKNRLVLAIIKFYKNVFWYPDQYMIARKKATESGKKILQQMQVTAIISSALPVSSHLIANELKQKSNLCWVADYRDLWSQNHYTFNYPIRSYFETRLEKKTLKSATAIVTVSAPLCEELTRLHPHCPVYNIRNGYDPDLFNEDAPISKDFSITYTGSLYKGRRDPSVFFKVIAELIKEKKISRTALSIQFYCKKETWLIDTVNKYNLNENVFIHGLVPRQLAIEKQRSSQLLLLLTWDNPEEKGVYTSKVFEYLAARRPIISMGFGEGGILKDLLDQTHAGVHITNEDDLKSYLLNAYREYVDGGSVCYHPVEQEILKYSHKCMAKKFADVLDEVTLKSKIQLK